MPERTQISKRQEEKEHQIKMQVHLIVHACSVTDKFMQQLF